MAFEAACVLFEFWELKQPAAFFTGDEGIATQRRCYEILLPVSSYTFGS